MRTLVFCPCWRLEPETVDRIFRIEPVDDGEDATALDVVFARWNPTRNGEREAILWQYRRARRMTIDGNYDALFTIESDVIPPTDCLSRLAAVDADVAHGLYVFRRSTPPVANALRYIEGIKHPEQSWSLFPREWAKLLRDRGVIRTSGAGLGCTFIRRYVLEAIDFRAHGIAHNDWQFAIDCLRFGYRLAVDLDCVCGHKEPGGSILWPDGSETAGERFDDWSTAACKAAGVSSYEEARI